MRRRQGTLFSTTAGTWKHLALAGSFIIAMLTSGGLVYFASVPSDGAQIIQEIVDSHVRSLLAEHLTDITSSNQNTVKAWFDRQLNTTTEVKDFTAQGFPLIGGRLDYIDNRPVATVIYRHNKHPINLFIWAHPVQSLSHPEGSSRQGYNIRYWVQGDVTFWLISDLDGESLAQLESLIRGPI